MKRSNKLLIVAGALSLALIIVTFIMMAIS
jgi:hypothetical protein